MPQALLALALLALAGGAAAAAPPPSVPVVLRSTAPVALARAPLSAGIPLAPGVWKAGSRVALADGGDQRPAQVRVLSRWPDDSARWLQVDVEADLAARESRAARLLIHPAPAADGGSAPLRLSSKPDHIRVDTGKAQFRLPRSGDAWLTVGDPRDGGLAFRGFAVLDGSEKRASGERRLEVVESGPLRVRIALSGTYGSFRHTVRIDFFAGRSSVRVLHSFANHGPAAYTQLDELGVVVDVEAPFESLAFDLVDGGRIAGSVADAERRIVQTGPRALEDAGARRDAQGSGWAAAAAGGRHAAFAGRYFWQEYPQAFGFGPKAFTYWLKAPTDHPVRIGSGAAKTHEFWLLLGGTKDEAAELAALAQPRVLWPVAEHTAATGAVRNALPTGTAAQSFLSSLRRSIAAYERTQADEAWDDSGHIACGGEASRRRVGAFGMLHFGDWNFPGYRDDVKGCDAWGNLEYDTAQVLALAYSATGDPELHDAMVAAARHFADVDRIHFSQHQPRWVGMNHPKNPLHFTFELGGVDLGHTWNEGLFSVGRMTVDDSLLHAGREIADYLVRRRQSGVGFRGNPRQWGWPQVALVAAYEHTGEQRYREAALWYGHRGMRSHAPNELAQWKLGILAEGLAYTDSVAPDAQLRDWLGRYAEAVMSERPRDARFYPALAYAYRLRRDEAWRNAASEVVAGLGFGSWGKPMTIAGRIGFAVLADLSAAPPGAVR